MYESVFRALSTGLPRRTGPHALAAGREAARLDRSSPRTSRRRFQNPPADRSGGSSVGAAVVRLLQESEDVAAESNLQRRALRRRAFGFRCRPWLPNCSRRVGAAGDTFTALIGGAVLRDRADRSDRRNRSGRIRPSQGSTSGVTAPLSGRQRQAVYRSIGHSQRRQQHDRAPKPLRVGVERPLAFNAASTFRSALVAPMTPPGAYGPHRPTQGSTSAGGSKSSQGLPIAAGRPERGRLPVRERKRTRHLLRSPGEGWAARRFGYKNVIQRSETITRIPLPSHPIGRARGAGPTAGTSSPGSHGAVGPPTRAPSRSATGGR